MCNVLYTRVLRVLYSYATESLANWPAYYPEQRFTRPVLFLLNPRGGSGRALEIFKNVINPALYEAGIEYSLFITGTSMHIQYMYTLSHSLSDHFPRAPMFTRALCSSIYSTE